MDVKKIVVAVEDVDAARTALQWALRNIIRYGDIITLLHVYHHSTRSKSKARLLRLNGFKLALSFQDMCNNYPNTKVEIIVTEGDQEGAKIAATVREIGASMLVVGLHDSSFLYKLTMAHSHNSIGSIFNCRVFAIKQPHVSPVRPMISAVSVLDSSTNMDFSQIDLSRLQVPRTPPQKIPYRICPNPSAIIWRSRKSRRR
ncbi:hypothetical protein AAZX31_06G199000 [Glycine max]|uniref:UspA domain-containing protein n=4 Tax=Glycine subgen. Soja TaxID=1462606 RepID=I1KD67_SOYBN|nr:uncharacterized protein LOC100778166 isoform X1 [Glycine max]XP_028237427.1 uncharacterized protein LOC114416672 isoform X1 [Glycine soja]KAG5020010.1 hypothetical protein JHK87_015865 [Glycine soja]KAH1126928.1 hypothetical protein GYH30_015767 [Glycine max]KAH1246647.1 hypothetical protein GmHk_06G016683 [Glycine max]KHN03691.1 hypothetical protein glysoja_041238 [Glycine soja]KRH54797.1 hypothetical protein GLYMA_06G209600v4 [Glycine max]|eukprot:XP_003527131.1 uncharacterized protein LOC100778166 isoform X1 [Glycine max]